MITTSKYEENGFADIISGLVKVYNPKVVIELGTQQGASAVIIGKALKDGLVYTYDLFGSNYKQSPYLETHADLAATQDNIAKNNLTDKIIVLPLDATEVAERWDKVDMLHIDLCNHYDNVRPLLHQWYKKVKQLIILEGGGFNKWQKANAFIPFSFALHDRCIYDYYNYVTIIKNEDYALTILIRRTNDTPI